MAEPNWRALCAALLPYAESRAEDMSALNDELADAPHTPEQLAEREESIGFANQAWAAVQQAAEALDRAPSPPSSLPRLGVIIDGGIVQAVVSDQPEVLARSMGAILVIDYDTDGSDREDLVEIPGHDGLLAEAWQIGLTRSQIDLDAVLDAANALDERGGIHRPQAPCPEAHARQAPVLNAGG